MSYPGYPFVWGVLLLCSRYSQSWRQGCWPSMTKENRKRNATNPFFSSSNRFYYLFPFPFQVNEWWLVHYFRREEFNDISAFIQNVIFLDCRSDAINNKKNKQWIIDGNVQPLLAYQQQLFLILWANIIMYSFRSSTLTRASRMGNRILWLYPLQMGLIPSQKKRRPDYDTKMHLIVQFSFWNSG